MKRKVTFNFYNGYDQLGSVINIWKDVREIYLFKATCPKGKIGLCGPEDNYPMEDPTKIPGFVTCLQR